VIAAAIWGGNRGMDMPEMEAIHDEVFFKVHKKTDEPVVFLRCPKSMELL
jgi:hypothetical protein